MIYVELAQRIWLSLEQLMMRLRRVLIALG